MAQPTSALKLNNPGHSALHNAYVNVKMFDAEGDGVTDDTDAFNNALAAAGAGAHVFAPTGTYVLNNLNFTGHGQRIVGTGPGSTILTLKAGGSYVVRESGLWACGLEDLMIDGNSKTGAGLVLTGSDVRGSQRHHFKNVHIKQCTIGVDIQAGAANQVDRNTYLDCYVFECDTGIKINSNNGQEQVLLNTSVSGCTYSAVECIYGSLDWFGGQILSSGKGLYFSSGAFLWANQRGIIYEGNTVDVEGTTWTTKPLLMENCVQAAPINIGASGSILIMRGCTVNNPINATANDVLFIDELNTFAGAGAWNPTGVNDRRWKADVNGWKFNVPVAATTGFEWGDAGAAAMDTNLYRSAADTLKTDDKIHVVGEIELDAALNHDGTTVGFYGTAPTTKPAALTAADASTVDGTYGAEEAAVIANLRTRLGELETKLQSLGLLS